MQYGCQWDAADQNVVYQAHETSQVLSRMLIVWMEE